MPIGTRGSKAASTFCQHKAVLPSARLAAWLPACPWSLVHISLISDSELDCYPRHVSSAPIPAKMVSVNSLLTRTVAYLASSATADTTPQQVADDINQLAQKSQALQGTAQSITALNAPLIMLEEGPFRVCMSNLMPFPSRDRDLLMFLRTSLAATPTLSSLARTSFPTWMGLVPLLGRTLTRSTPRSTR